MVEGYHDPPKVQKDVRQTPLSSWLSLLLFFDGHFFHVPYPTFQYLSVMYIISTCFQKHVKFQVIFETLKRGGWEKQTNNKKKQAEAELCQAQVELD